MELEFEFEEKEEEAVGESGITWRRVGEEEEGSNSVRWIWMPSRVGGRRREEEEGGGPAAASLSLSSPPSPEPSWLGPREDESPRDTSVTSWPRLARSWGNKRKTN